MRVLVLLVELSWSVLSLATNERLSVGTCDDGRCRGGSHSDYRGDAGGVETCMSFYSPAACSKLTHM